MAKVPDKIPTTPVQKKEPAIIPYAKDLRKKYNLATDLSRDEIAKRIEIALIGDNPLNYFYIRDTETLSEKDRRELTTKGYKFERTKIIEGYGQAEEEVSVTRVSW